MKTSARLPPGRPRTRPSGVGWMRKAGDRIAGVSAGVLAACFSFALFGLAACSRAAPHPAPADLPPECDAFVTQFESCLKTTVPSQPQVAEAKAAQTRAALLEQVARASVPSTASSTSSTASITALANKCHENLTRLTASCSAVQSTH